jgi:WD40 repeat protein
MANSTLPQGELPQNNNPKIKANWQVGDVLLGVYEVKGVIAQGGMGIVYHIYHRGWDLDLAVKSPRADKHDAPSVIDNYLRECETWVDLGLHPNIATCYYVRNIDGLPRIFSEFVKGGSLKDWISSHRLYSQKTSESLETILDIAIQTAWGLNYAHEKNVIHQDVKPSNILVSNNKIAKITDFGVSRARVHVSSYTENQGTVFAKFGGMTPEYCSPEQANKTMVSRKTDIWSWAISILEMFTGEATWLSGVLAPQVLSQYLEEEQVPNYIPRMPKEISNLLSRCFEVNPEARPKSLELISNELVAIYEKIVGYSYQRRYPESLKLFADSLNNQGVSLWDIGKYQEAMNSWDKAIIQEPLHAQATYNKLLIQWRAGQITDQVVIRNLESILRDRPANEVMKIILGDVHLERGDLQSAEKFFKNISISQLSETITERRLYIHNNLENSRFLKQRLENSSSIIGAKFSENNKKAFSISGAKSSLESRDEGSNVQIWNLNNGDCEFSFHIQDKINSASFDLNKNLLVTGGMPSNRNIRARVFGDKINVWNLKTGQKIKSIDGFTSGVTAVDNGPDGSIILSGGYDKQAGIWDVFSGMLIKDLKGHARTVTCVRFTSDMKYCFTGEGFASSLLAWNQSKVGMCIKMWKVSDGNLIKEFIGHEDSIRCISLNNENSLLASSSDDKTIKIWDISSGKCISTLTGHVDMVYAVTFFNEEKIILSGGADDTVRIWDLNHGRCIFTFGEHSQRVNVVTNSEDNDLILSGGDDGLILWTSGHNLPLYQAPFALCNTMLTETQIAAQDDFESLLTQSKVALSSSNYSLCTSLIKAARNIPNQSRSPEAIQIWQNLYQVGHTAEFISAWLVKNYSGDEVHYEINQAKGKKTSLKYVDGKAYHVTDISTRRTIKKIASNRNINSVCLSHNALYVFTAEGGTDNELAVWDIFKGTRSPFASAQRLCISSSEFDRTDKFVITGEITDEGFGVIKKWDVGKRKCIQEFVAHKSPINVIYICKQIKRLITGSGWSFKSEKGNENSIKVWDSDSGESIYVLDSHTATVNCFSVSHNEDYLFSASRDCTIKMWDLNRGKEIRSFESHKGDVTCLDISPNQKYIVSGSWDKSVIIWNIQNGEMVFTAKFDDPIRDVCFSQEGDYLLINTWDNILHKYFIDWDIEIV